MVRKKRARTKYSTRGGNTGYASKQPKDDGGLRLEEPIEQLLPGICDELTKHLIVPKLTWRAFRILSPMNRAWRQVFRRTLNARLRSLATETEVLVESLPSADSIPFDFRDPRGQESPLRVENFRLFSVANGFTYRLPPLPNLGIGYAGSGFPTGCKCVFLNGKVYALGGEHYDRNYVQVPGKRVYMLDLAGLRQWKQCNSMRYARRSTNEYEAYAYAIRGKIYVCGGEDKDGRDIGDFIEVYDTETSTWEQIIMWPPQLPFHKFIPGFRDAVMTSIKNRHSTRWTKSHAMT